MYYSLYAILVNANYRHRSDNFPVIINHHPSALIFMWKHRNCKFKCMVVNVAGVIILCRIRRYQGIMSTEMQLARSLFITRRARRWESWRENSRPWHSRLISDNRKKVNALRTNANGKLERRNWEILGRCKNFVSYLSIKV